MCIISFISSSTAPSKTQLYQSAKRHVEELEDELNEVNEKIGLLQSTDKDLREAIARQEVDLEQQRKQLQRQRVLLDEKAEKKRWDYLDGVSRQRLIISVSHQQQINEH